MVKKKIIFLITFSTKPSEYENQPRPEFVWHNPNGEMIGIWGLEWGNLLIKALADYYPEYECEVWQPDLRADKVYAAELQPRVWHRKFPAVIKTRMNLFRITGEIYSQMILNEVKTQDLQDTVFMLPPQVRTKWLDDIIRSIKNSKVLYYNFLNAQSLLPITINASNPVKSIKRYFLNRQKERWMMRMQNLLTSEDNPQALNKLKKRYPKLMLYYFKMGMDFDFWYPVVSKQTAREELNIPQKEFVIVLSQRLVPEYQVDKFIEVLARLAKDHEFVCYISGHGSQEYEEYLSNLINSLKLAGKVFLRGFVSDEDLRNYLIAADLFATVPQRFAGSGGALKASAVGTPVLHVRSGNSYEFLRKHGAGEYVDPTSYDEWFDKLGSIIEGKIVNTVERRELVDYYSWRSTAEELDYALNNLN